MKKTLLAVAFSLAAGHAMASDAITITYELSKNNEVISKASGTVADGHELPFIHGTERGYVKGATGQGSNIVLTPGVVSTGFKMLVIPKEIGEGKILLAVTAEQVDLLGMDKTKDGDLEIEIPLTDELKIQRLMVNDGKPTEVALGKTAAGNTYVIQVTAKTGEKGTLQKAAKSL